jgi:hypothetical protein
MQDARDPRAFTLPPQATCRGQRDKGISVHHVAMHDVLRTRCLAGDGFLRRELLALGYDDNAIAAKVRAGEWVRVRQGGYFLTALWNELDEVDRHLVRSRMVSRACRVPHVLSHTTAVLHHAANTWDLDLADVHVTRDDARSGRAKAGVRQHRGVLVGPDVVDVGVLRITSPARSALELTTVTDTERALVVIDDMLRRRLVTQADLWELSERMTYWPSTLATTLAVRLSDPRAESPAETRFRYLCWCMGIPAPQTQVEIRDPSGRLIARLDFAWPQFKTFAEIDGYVKYAGDPFTRSEPPASVVVREKRREDDVRRVTGWRCLRFMWPDLDHRERTAHLLRTAFAASVRGHYG